MVAVSEQEKKDWQKMYDGADPSATDVPEGKYEMVITECEPNPEKFRLVSKVMIIGGSEKEIGKTLIVYDNLASALNIKFFKKKLAALKIAYKNDWEVTYGTDRKSLSTVFVGRVFEGQVKNGDLFQNVYFNKFKKELDSDEFEELMESMGVKSEGKENEEEDQDQDQDESSKFSVGDEVKWVSSKYGDLQGEIKEILEDEEKARVFVEEKDKVLRVSLEKLVRAETDSKNDEEEEEEEEEEESALARGNGSFPKVEKVREMRMPEVRKLLKKFGLKIDKIQSPKEFASGVAGFFHDDTYKPELKEMHPLCVGLGIVWKKGTRPAKVTREIRDKVREVFG